MSETPETSAVAPPPTDPAPGEDARASAAGVAQRGGEGRRRPGRRGHRAGDRAAGPWPRAARGRARHRQDAPGARPRRVAGARHQARPVHPRPHAGRRHGLARLRRTDAPSSRSAPGRCSPTCSSPTRSTARRRRRRPHCWRRWRSGRSVGRRHGMPVDRDLPLLHRLQRCGLVFGGVRFVGEEQVGEHRPGAERELGASCVVDGRARDVARHEVGGELDALGVQGQRRARARTRSVLAVPGTPSSSAWARTSKAITSPVTTASWPTTAFATSLRNASSAWRASSPGAGSVGGGATASSPGSRSWAANRPLECVEVVGQLDECGSRPGPHRTGGRRRRGRSGPCVSDGRRTEARLGGPALADQGEQPGERHAAQVDGRAVPRPGSPVEPRAPLGRLRRPGRPRAAAPRRPGRTGGPSRAPAAPTAMHSWRTVGPIQGGDSSLSGLVPSRRR